MHHIGPDFRNYMPVVAPYVVSVLSIPVSFPFVTSVDTSSPQKPVTGSSQPSSPPLSNPYLQMLDEAFILLQHMGPGLDDYLQLILPPLLKLLDLQGFPMFTKRYSRKNFSFIRFSNFLVFCLFEFFGHFNSANLFNPNEKTRAAEGSTQCNSRLNNCFGV